MSATVVDDEFEDAVHDVYCDAEDLLLSKHDDYGPKNIADAPGGALNGLLVRLHDKLARLAHLTAADAKPNHESLRDTLMDIANYGVIGVLVVDGSWPGVPARDGGEDESAQWEKDLLTLGLNRVYSPFVTTTNTATGKQYWCQGCQTYHPQWPK